MQKIKLLFLAANPLDQDKLSLDEEIRAISQKLRASDFRDFLFVESAWALRADDLIQLLNEHKPHIVHFSGHGSFKGEIILQDGTGRSHSVNSKALKALFTTLKDNIRVIVLNACSSAQQARALRSIIDCTISMETEISDKAAITFAASFYRALGFGRSVKEAFDQGIAALLLEGIKEENTPKLLVKRGIDPSNVFVLRSSSQSDENRAVAQIDMSSMEVEDNSKTERHWPIKNEPVFHDKPYIQPQTGQMMPRDFFDRQTEKERILRVLHEPDHRPVIIMGERRSGKTSMLRLIDYHLNNNPSRGFVTILLTWMGIRSRLDLMNEILYRVGFALGKEPPVAPISSSTTVAEFMSQLRGVISIAPLKTFVICIDELDSMLFDNPDRRERYQIMGLLVSFMEMTELPFKLLLTMTRLPTFEGEDYSPHLRYKAEQVPLAPFSRQDQAVMLAGIVGKNTLSNMEIDDLYKLSGGWPYFTKVLLESLETIPRDDNWIENGLMGAIENPSLDMALRHIFEQHFDSDEKAFVQLLVANNGNIGADRVMGLSIELRRAASSLTARGYLIANEDGGYRFRVGLLQSYFRSKNRGPMTKV